MPPDLPAPPLTRRQQAVYEHLRERARRGARAPSLEELCRALGLRSRGSLHRHVRALVAAGLVEPLEGRQRGVRLSAAASPPAAREEQVSLPFAGWIAAGHPLEAVENPEPVEVPARLRGRGRCYVLGVRGDSMVEAGILDGDWVVVEQRSHARDGEIVVALIDGHEATLKRIEQQPGRVVLHPANARLGPMAFAPERVLIQGVVTGQMRRYG